MRVQITVEMEGRPAQTLTEELSGSAQELEEQVLRLTQRTGRIVLEQGLQQAALSARTPCCCGRPLKNCGLRTHTLTSLMGELVSDCRRYRCRNCGRACYPADAGMCCGEHRV